MGYMTDLLENFRFEVEGKTVLFLSRYVNDLFRLCVIWLKRQSRATIYQWHFLMIRFSLIIFYPLLR